MFETELRSVHGKRPMVVAGNGQHHSLHPMLAQTFQDAGQKAGAEAVPPPARPKRHVEDHDLVRVVEAAERMASADHKVVGADQEDAAEAEQPAQRVPAEGRLRIAEQVELGEHGDQLGIVKVNLANRELVALAVG